MTIHNRFIKLTISAAALLLAVLSSPASAQGPNALLTTANPRVKEVIAVQEMVTDGLMATDGVLGTAVSADSGQNPVLVVYVNAEHGRVTDVLDRIPRSYGKIDVRIQLTDPFRSMVKYIPARGPGSGGKPGGGSDETTVDHKGIQDFPIQLGTSGGWGDDLANGYCCGGTLGSLIQVGVDKRILSNYHVFEADIENGGNGTTAQTGNPVIQPGLIDVSCNANNAQDVATLVKSSSLPNSNVDASSAVIIPGMVDETGAILEIGTISSSTVAASVGQKVKKSGRTTGLSRSKVSGLNATVSVAYDDECAGGSAFTKTFTGQIIIDNKGSKFLAGGDSGSLMVEDVTSDPSAVGLLFAGSRSLAVANPIDEVLDFFGVDASMVGN